MTDPTEDADELLSQYLRALSSSTRLRILRALRVPTRAADLEVPASRERSGLSAGRVLSRPAVIHHLNELEELALVKRVEPEGEYVVNQQILFSLLEELGSLGRLKPVVEVDVEETRAPAPEESLTLPPPPRLVVVAGPREGDALRLAGAGPWLVGRGAECGLRLQHDPHVSRVHVVVARAGGHGFTVEHAAPGNPARVDYRPLAEGRPVRLAPGALVSIGASRLVFQADAAD